MKVFIDNNIILDAILPREEYSHSIELLSLIEKKQLSAYISPIIFTNTFYIVKRLQNAKKAWSAIQKISLLFNIVAIDEKITNLALASEFNDFEDAMQYYAALSKKVDYLITRNKKDFIGSDLQIVTPLEFLAIKELSI